MKETTNFDDFSVKKAISLAKTFAKDAYTKELGVVLSVAFRDIRNLPALKFNQNEPIPLKEYVKKWVARYLSGYNGRPSKRQGKKSQTKPDPAVKLILRTRREDIDDNFADTQSARRISGDNFTPVWLVLLLGKHHRRGRLLQGRRLFTPGEDKQQFGKQLQYPRAERNRNKKMVSKIFQ